MNLSVLLEDSARKYPDRDALVLGPTRLSYAQVNAAANQVANLLVERGVQPGDKVALSCPNLPWFPIVYYGILKAAGSWSRSTSCSKRPGDCWTIAEAAGHRGPHRLQRLLSRAVWDEQQVLDVASAWAARHLDDGDAVLTVDETADEKSSADCVGAARQYSGTTGDVALCQVAVTLTYATGRGHALIGRALYLPGRVLLITSSAARAGRWSGGGAAVYVVLPIRGGLAGRSGALGSVLAADSPRADRS